jgi:tetratricopeptide (TPR) repeat protein
LEETLKLQTAVLGRDNLDTASTMVCLAGVYAMQQRHGPAIRLDQEVLSLPCAKQNPEDPTFLAATRDLATVYWYSGRQKDARAIWEEVLPRQRDRWGSGHPMTLITVRNLAMEYRRVKRFADAISFSKELYDTLKTKYGANDAEALNALLDLAKTYLAAGRLDDANTQVNVLLESQPKNAEVLKIRDQVQDKLQAQSAQTENSK